MTDRCKELTLGPTRILRRQPGSPQLGLHQLLFPQIRDHRDLTGDLFLVQPSSGTHQGFRLAILDMIEKNLL